MNKDEIDCLHCGTNIYAEADLAPQCPHCKFYNVILKEEDFEDFIDLNNFDPLFAHERDLDSGFMHYAWPSITKEEYETFREKSPDRARAIFKLLKGDRLTEKESLNLRVLKSINKRDRRDLEGRIRYLKTKKKIIDLLEKIK
jgi:phage FluMu protein Com